MICYFLKIQLKLFFESCVNAYFIYWVIFQIVYRTGHKFTIVQRHKLLSRGVQNVGLTTYISP